MKKIMTSIKTLAIMLMAGAALIACSEDINIIDEQPENPTEPQAYTMVINAAKGEPATRALGFDSDGNLNATWATDENVYVKKGSTWATGSLKPQADGKTATLKGSLSDITIAAGDNLTLQFPRSGAIKYDGQVGTLDDIQANFDWATATVEVESVSSSGSITPKAPTTTFTNKQAIAKFTLTDKANDAALNATKLVLKVDLSDAKKTALAAVYSQLQTYLPVYELNPTDATYEANGGTGILFLAIPYPSAQLTAINTLLAPLTLTTEDFVFTLTATVGSDTYTLTKSGFPFENGKYYAITAKMTKLPPATGHALSASVVGDIVGSNGLAYAVEDKDNLPTGVTAVAMVAYKNGSKGLAIELRSSSLEYDYNGASSYIASLPSVVGGTWCLPRYDHWQNMFLGCRVDGDADKAPESMDPSDTIMRPIKGFVEKIAATGYRYGSVYWTRSIYEDSDRYQTAWTVSIELNGNPVFADFYAEDNNMKYMTASVLGCLVF